MYQLAMAYQVTIQLGTAFLIKARQGNQQEEKVPRQVMEAAPALTIWSRKKKPHNYDICESAYASPTQALWLTSQFL